MIYVVKAVGTEYVKIGVSRGIGPRMNRLLALQGGCPFELVLIAQADWPHREERRIHAHLRRNGMHVRLEWFRRAGETDIVINMLQDGKYGLADWYKRSTPSTNRRLAKVIELARM